jgi:hypothetical protein
MHRLEWQNRRESVLFVVAFGGSRANRIRFGKKKKAALAAA